jgi:hypothetical protein
LHFSQRNLALLRGVDLLEEHIDVEGVVIILLFVFLPQWRLWRGGGGGGSGGACAPAQGPHLARHTS